MRTLMILLRCYTNCLLKSLKIKKKLANCPIRKIGCHANGTYFCSFFPFLMNKTHSNTNKNI